MAFQILVHRLQAFLDTDFDTPEDAFRAAQQTLRSGAQFSVHPVVDGVAGNALLDGIAPEAIRVPDPRREDCCAFHRYGGLLDAKCR